MFVYRTVLAAVAELHGDEAAKRAALQADADAMKKSAAAAAADSMAKERAEHAQIEAARAELMARAETSAASAAMVG
jgi:hypothetical protein